jgi:hypothetical protein
MKHTPACCISAGFLGMTGFLFSALEGQAQQQIPDVRLRITVQQREDGKLNPAFHIQELRCFSGNCSLTTITINDCRPSPVSAGQASPAIIERTSTQEGNLKVTNEGNTLVTVATGSDIGGSYTTTERFIYETPRLGGIALRLVGYSGGAVKNSLALKKVITIEYVPLKEASRGAGHSEVTLNCPLGLPAVTAPLR